MSKTTVAKRGKGKKQAVGGGAAGEEKERKAKRDKRGEEEEESKMEESDESVPSEGPDENVLSAKKGHRKRSSVNISNKRSKLSEPVEEQEMDWDSISTSPRKAGPLGLLNGVESRVLRSQSLSTRKSAEERTTQINTQLFLGAETSELNSRDTEKEHSLIPLPGISSGDDVQASSTSSSSRNGISAEAGLKSFPTVPPRVLVVTESVVQDDQRPSTSRQAMADLAAENAKSFGTSEVVPREDRSRSTSPELLPEDIYEVEKILDYINNSNGEVYFVKWKGWGDEHNTWEPPENLLDCFDKKWEFYQSRKADRAQLDSENPRKNPAQSMTLPPDPRPLNIRINEALADMNPITEAEKEAAWTKLNKGQKTNRWGIPRVERHLVRFGERLNEDEAFRSQAILYHVEYLRTTQLHNLKKWGKKINSITNGMPILTIENTVDLADHPMDFRYVNDYVITEGITVPDDPPVGCACKTACYENRKECCPGQMGVNFAYTQKKTLRVAPGTPIYECNRKCLCGPECANRVVQDGVTPLKGMKMCIFRTLNGCGWGVKTLTSIKKGTFVCLYIGEIINTEEAERRGRDYDDEGITYLFDLDFNEDEKNECPYTVDAKNYGNISHFMNHSCDPNLTVYSVWVNCLDPNLPKLALFANRNIAKNEELTFDYKSFKGGSDTDSLDSKPESADGPSKAPIPLIKRKPCLCGTSNCRKILF